MTRPLPLPAVLLSVAGLLPFLLCGVLAVGLDGDRAALALIAYGAVVLAFLGAVHWGFALQEPSGRGEGLRLVLGVLPSLAGWVAVLLAIAVNVASALGWLVVGFVAVAAVEARGAAAQLVPRGYLRLRYALTATVATVLVLVLLMRLFGVHLQL